MSDLVGDDRHKGKQNFLFDLGENSSFIRKLCCELLDLKVGNKQLFT